MKKRTLAGSLSLSAAAFVGLLVSEGYSPTAYVPTQGDRPTVGFGTTFHPSGEPVQPGDRLDPVRAVMVAHEHLSADERRFRESLPGVALLQEEYDLYMDFVYQYGIQSWQQSSMRRHLLAGEYRQACDALLLWRRQAGRDCSLPEHWGPQGCKGVWTRQLERHAKCVALQEGGG